MQFEGRTTNHRVIGKLFAWGIFFLIILYTIVTVLGLLNLDTP